MRRMFSENQLIKIIADYMEGHPFVQEQADWSESDNTSPAYIKNKPELFSGAYDDLTGAPFVYDDEDDSWNNEDNDFYLKGCIYLDSWEELFANGVPLQDELEAKQDKIYRHCIEFNDSDYADSFIITVILYSPKSTALSFHEIYELLGGGDEIYNPCYGITTASNRIYYIRSLLSSNVEYLTFNADGVSKYLDANGEGVSYDTIDRVIDINI